MKSEEAQIKVPRLEKPVRITEQVWPEGTVPVVSICCITYQHVNFIRDAIEGFLMQETTFPLEIIIRDDASTDGTAEIVKEYAEKYPRFIRTILHIENQNSKGKKALPEIFAIARGYFIAICDGDDYWTHSLKLERQARAFFEDSSMTACFHNATHEDTRTELKGCRIARYPKDFLETADFLYTTPTTTCTAMVKREIMAHVSTKFDDLQMGDVPLWITASMHGRLRWLHENMAVYRLHHGGMHSSKSVAQGFLAGLERFQRLFYILPPSLHIELYKGTGLQAARAMNSIGADGDTNLLSRVRGCCTEFFGKPSFIRSFLQSFIALKDVDDFHLLRHTSTRESAYRAAVLIGCNGPLLAAIYYDLIGTHALRELHAKLACPDITPIQMLVARAKAFLKSFGWIFAKIAFYPIVKFCFLLQARNIVRLKAVL
jgi:glycosyltransferase involved in cell wall biosynthesis